MSSRPRRRPWVQLGGRDGGVGTQGDTAGGSRAGPPCLAWRLLDPPAAFCMKSPQIFLAEGPREGCWVSAWSFGTEPPGCSPPAATSLTSLELAAPAMNSYRQRGCDTPRHPEPPQAGFPPHPPAWPGHFQPINLQVAIQTLAPIGKNPHGSRGGHTPPPARGFAGAGSIPESPSPPQCFFPDTGNTFYREQFSPAERTQIFSQIIFPPGQKKKEE